MVLSRDADATKCPDGEKQTDITASYNNNNHVSHTEINKQTSTGA